jgi:diguanylate cyclase (GGDEF)-like protein/PAS domain S-box-containing protein
VCTAAAARHPEVSVQQDRTAARVQQDRTAVSRHDLLSAFDNAPIGMAVLTPAGVITACNAAMGRLLARDATGLVGRTFFDVTHPDDLDDARLRCAEMQADGARVVRHECRFVLPDERVIWVSVSTARVPATPQRPAHLIMHIEDVSDRKRLEAELHHRALHDPLTGLANRTLLAERMREVLARRGRHARVGHLFFLDLDGFKNVNDRFGHAAGDAVLTQLAQRILALLRTGDVAARLGGDEFAVLCDDTEPQHAVSIAERLRMAAAEPFVVDGSTIRLSAAVGCCTTDHTDPAALLREADRRMYEGKRRRARPVTRRTS